MAKKRVRSSGSNVVGGLFSFVVWVTALLVSLAVGFGMVDGVLAVKFIPSVITVAAGWIVVILTVIGVILKITGEIGR
jgi:hypothetical protein